MGSTLTNGIYLPAEGERNCYTGLAANWSALDSLIGGYNAHAADLTIHVTAADKEAWNGKADSSALTAHTGDATIHVTAADKQAWDGHVADSVKHVTAADKAKWDAVTSKANDSDVVHKSGNETVSGVKTFSDNPVIGSNNANITVSNRQIAANGSYSTPTGNSYSYIQLKAMVNYTDSSPSIDATVGLSVQENAYSDGKNRAFNPSSNNLIDLGLPDRHWANVYATNYYYGSNNVEFSTKFVTTDTNQTISGAKTFEGVVKLKSVVGEYTVSGGSSSLLFYDKNSLLLSQYKLGVCGSGIPYQVFNIVGYDSNNQQVSKSITFSSSYLDLSKTFLKPDTDNVISLGRSNNRWSDVQTYKVNGVEPSSLSLPNLSAGVDISGYITNLNKGVNTYTPPANGWLNIRIRKTSLVHASLMIYQTGGLLSSCETDEFDISGTNLPVIANQNVEIYIYADVLVSAKFYPCQGNI